MNIKNKIIIRTPFSPTSNSVDKNDYLEHIYLSSPNLIPEIKKYRAGKLGEKEKQKLEQTLYKYKSRLSTRSTPFGLFAGIGMVNVGEKKSIQLPEKSTYKKYLRLDMNYLAALVRHIEQVPEIQDLLSWSVNTSLYKQHNKYRYIEHYFNKANKFHKLSAVDYSSYLEKIFETAKFGSNLDDIANSIVNEDILFQDAKNFVNELVQSQLLVSSLEPSITSDRILGDLINNVKKINCKSAKKVYYQLLLIKFRINEINSTSVGEDVKYYENLIFEIEKLGVGFEKSKLFQVDMYIPEIAGSVDEQIIKDIEKSIEFLKYFSIDFDPLKDEKEKFRKLYEGDEVPLFKVFDAENGMNFSTNSSVSPLIDKVGVYYGGNSEMKIQQTPQENFTNKLYKEAMKEGKKVVTLSEKSLPESIKKNKTKKQLPPTYSSIFSILKEEGKNKIFLGSLGGSSALNLLGRFGHLDEEYNSYIKQLAKKEEEILKGAIVADIVHLPEDRVGNILIRPVLHDYQIPYLSKANVEKEYELQISELVLSLKGDRFVLRSKRLNKEIIPRLSNAHNYSNPMSLGIYKFLCSLQNQDILPWLGFNWGHLRSYYVYSPRVEYNNVILSLAKWNFVKEDAKEMIDAFKKSKEELDNEIDNWQKTHDIPNQFLLAEGDNELYINLKDSLSRRVFVNEIRRKPSFTLNEYLMSSDNDYVSAKDGNYAHQFVVSFVNENYKLPVYGTSNRKNEVKRKFSPGSEWLYFKVYAGAKTLDNLLKNEFKSLIDYLIEKEIVDKWFFIRYSDPDLHLRIRFHFKDVLQIQFVIQKLNELTHPFIKNKIIHVFQMDTYNRELERYGTNTMELSESLFYQDSQVIISFLDLIEGDSGEEIRWLFALKLIDSFLSDLQFDIDQKIEFVTMLRDSFTQEFNFQKPQRTALNNKFRDKRKVIDKMLQTEIDGTEEWYPLFELLNYKSEVTKDEITTLISIKEKLEMKFSNLIASYTHMSLNRIFLSNPRLNETAVYFMLEKYYRSIKAYNPKRELNLLTN